MRVGARSQLCPNVGFGISIVELLCLNSGEPVNITTDFVFTECFTGNEVNNYCKFRSPAGFDMRLSVQLLHNGLYNGLVRGMKEEVINHGCGKIQKVRSVNTNLNP